ncbi:MAG: PCRF domain-containing protein, partial [Phycisphaerae bacterium]|nr:PCRF domain-containing protein [Phycisphaerae bacterium]
METKSASLRELEAKMQAPTFWDNPDGARKVVGEMKLVKAMTEPVNRMTDAIRDLAELHELAREENDAETLEEVDVELGRLEGAMGKLELKSLLSGKHDHRNCYLSIFSGDGGTEANDWAEIMLRMYLYYCEKMKWKVEEMDKHMGEEAGISDVTLHIRGDYAYGYLTCERGTHRLARVSPFNAQGKRQTSFASVEVVPEL